MYIWIVFEMSYHLFKIWRKHVFYYVNDWMEQNVFKVVGNLKTHLVAQKFTRLIQYSEIVHLYRKCSNKRPFHP